MYAILISVYKRKKVLFPSSARLYQPLIGRRWALNQSFPSISLQPLAAQKLSLCSSLHVSPDPLWPVFKWRHIGTIQKNQKSAFCRLLLMLWPAVVQLFHGRHVHFHFKHTTDGGMLIPTSFLFLWGISRKVCFETFSALACFSRNLTSVRRICGRRRPDRTGPKNHVFYQLVTVAELWLEPGHCQWCLRYLMEPEPSGQHEEKLSSETPPTLAFPTGHHTPNCIFVITFL